MVRWMVVLGVVLISAGDICAEIPVDSDSMEAWIERGNTLVGKGRYDEAIAAYRKVVVGNHDEARIQTARHWIANALVKKADDLSMHQKEYDEAIQICREVLAEYPGSNAAPYASRKIGDIYYKMAEEMRSLEYWRKAIDATEQTLRDYPDHPIAASTHFHMGELLTASLIAFEVWGSEDLREYGRAIPHYRKAIERAGDRQVWIKAKALLRVSMCRHRLERSDEARDPLQEIVDRYPGTSWADEAAALLSYSFADSGREPRRLMRGAWDLFATGKHREAVEAYGEIVERYPGSETAASAYMMMGLSYDHLYGQTEDRSFLDKGIECYESSIGMGRRSPAAYYYLGNAHFQGGQYEKALDAFRNSLDFEHLPPFVERSAPFRMAQCYERLGRWNEAKAAYQQVIDAGMDSSLTARATKTLEKWEDRVRGSVDE